MSTATIVVLRFADRTLVDLVTDLSGQDAVIDFLGRSLRNDAATLPLLETVHAEVPAECIAKLRSSVTSARAAPRKPIVSIKGLIHAASAYVRGTGPDGDIAKARDVLLAFFANVDPDAVLDFAGEPEPAIAAAADG